MYIYEKPMAEFVKFESERILSGEGDIGDIPDVSQGVEEW